jgi:thiol-disulfide isomerase/thioredoxin
MSRRVRTGQRKRSNAIYIVPILVIVTGVVGYYIFTQSSTGGGGCTLCGTPVSSTVLNDLSGVSISTLNQVGKPSIVTSPASISGSTLTLNGKPEVLYLGAEYCPFCAAERWGIIVALDKFGTFTGIQYMESSSTDIFPNTPTFTFVGANYTSSYISFVTVEQADRSENPLQTATAEETSLLSSYDTCATTGQNGGIPFIDFANAYVVNCGSQYTPAALRVGDNANGAAYNWTQIAPQLNNASSVFAQSIDGTANSIISAICKVDGNAPSSVCSQSAAQTLGYTRMPPSGSSQPLVSDSVLEGQAPSVGASRFASPRLAAWV